MEAGCDLQPEGFRHLPCMALPLPTPLTVPAAACPLPARLQRLLGEVFGWRVDEFR